MTEGEFASQMSRLSETFGKNAYGTERARLIWNVVKDHSAQWFRTAVDDMIGNLRHPPMVPDFQEHARRESDRRWSETKVQERNQTQKWVSQFSNEDEQAMAQTIMKRLNGGVSEQDWESFLKLLKHMEVNS